MTALVVHGERAGNRAIGRPHTHGLANPKDPAVAVQLARRLMLSGAWRTAPKQGDDADKAVYTLRVHTPAALAVLPRAAVAALTRPVPLGGCSWCLAAFHAALSFGADPYPARNPLTRAFLGAECRRCKARHATSDAIAASLALYHNLVDEGVPPKVAAVSRTREDAYRRMAEIRALEQAQPPKAPRPTRTLQASGRRRRVPDPPYLQRQPIPWPTDARRVR